MDEYDKFIASLGSKGVDEVRINLSRGIWANKRKTWAQDWLAAQDSKLAAQREDTALTFAAADSASAREAIEVSREANKIAHAASVAATAAASLASDANNIARSNRWIAVIAAFIAAVAVIIAVFKK